MYKFGVLTESKWFIKIYRVQKKRSKSLLFSFAYLNFLNAQFFLEKDPGKGSEPTVMKIKLQITSILDLIH